MTDTFGTITGGIVIAISLAIIVYHVLQVAKTRRLETRSGAAIMFATGFIFLMLPQFVYTDLSADGLEAYSWLAGGMVVLAILIDASDRYRKRKDSSPEQQESAGR